MPDEAGATGGCERTPAPRLSLPAHPGDADGLQRPPDRRPKRLTAILHREEEVYVAECPEVGTVSQGDTVEEALANLREATELFLEECPQPALAPRLLTTFEVSVA